MGEEMMLKENNLTEAYEQLRRRMFNNGNKIENQSQLVFITKGMRNWLETIKDIKILLCKQHQLTSASPISLNIKPAAVAILTDMALKVVKEASIC